MNSSCIKAIARKDAKMAMRNKLLLLALFSGILFSLVYYALPSSIDETYSLAVYDEGSSQIFPSISGISSEGMSFDTFSTEKDCENAIQNGNYIAGIILPEDFDSLLLSGHAPHITLIFNYDVSEGTINSIKYFIQTLIDVVAFGKQPLQLQTEILGQDMSGMRTPLRDQSLPLYILMALMMEMWTISTLVVEENALGTLKAVLVTPASPFDVITAKGIVGCIYSLGVVVVILILTQSLRGSLPALFIGILLGAVMAVSIGLFLGSLTKNITGSYIYVAVPMLVFLLPALLILIPDVSLSALKVIPTYYLVNSFDNILNNGAGLFDVWKDYLVIGICDALFFVAGVYALRRQYK